MSDIIKALKDISLRGDNIKFDIESKPTEVSSHNLTTAVKFYEQMIMESDSDHERKMYASILDDILDFNKGHIDYNTLRDEVDKFKELYNVR